MTGRVDFRRAAARFISRKIDSHELAEVVWGCLKLGINTPEAELALTLAEHERGHRDDSELQLACICYFSSTMPMS